MLELYEKKFILTMDDGSLISCYWDLDDALADGKQLAARQKGETYRIFELRTKDIGNDVISYEYKLRETLRNPE